MKWAARDSRDRQQRIVAATLWTLVVAAFLYLFIAEAPGPIWLAYILGTALGVAIVGYFRLRGLQASTERHKLYMIMLSCLFPQVDRLMRTAETRERITAENRRIVERMAQVLTVNCFDSSISEAMESRFLDPVGFTVERLDVARCAAEVATDMPANDRAMLLDRPVDDVADILALLYFDRFGHDGSKTFLWKNRGDALVEPLAAVLVRRFEFSDSSVDEGELGTFLRSLGQYGFDAVEQYVGRRPSGVIDRMLDVLNSYAPKSPGGPAWPAPTQRDLDKVVDGQNPDGVQIKAAAQYCADLDPSAAPSAELLEFLYLRRFDRPRAIDHWTRRATSLTGELAGVLAVGRQLPHYAAVYSHNASFLIEIISALDEYSLASVQRVAAELKRHYDTATHVVQFVDRTSSVAIDPHELLQQVATSTGHGLPAREQGIGRLGEPEVSVGVVRWAAEQAIRPLGLASAMSGPAEIVTSGEFSLRTDHCPPGVTEALAHAAFDANAAAVLLGVLVERQYHDPDSEFGVLLGDGAKRAATLDSAMVRRVEDKLAVGAWPTELPDAGPNRSEGPNGDAVLKLDALSTELGDLHHLITNMPTDRALARFRAKLDRAPSAPDHDFHRLYLVTFDSLHGPLAALLDVLSSMSGPLEGRLYEMVEPDQTGWPRGNPRPGCLDGISQRAKDRYYNFGHYTRYTRLGVLPPNETFDTFATTFFDDVRCLLRLTNDRRDFRRPASGPIVEWKEVEVNLLSLGQPVRYDLYQPGEPSDREHSPLEDDELSRRVGEEVLKPMVTHRSPPSSK